MHAAHAAGLAFSASAIHLGGVRAEARADGREPVNWHWSAVSTTTASGGPPDEYVSPPNSSIAPQALPKRMPKMGEGLPLGDEARLEHPRRSHVSLYGPRKRDRHRDRGRGPVHPALDLHGNGWSTKGGACTVP